MVMASTVGKTVGATKEAMWRIKSMASGYIIGMMVEDMRVIGLLGNNMVKVSI